MKCLLLLLTLITFLVGTGWAAEDRRERDRDRGRPRLEERKGWTGLGSTVADFKTDRDRIEVGERGPFKEIMIVVEGGSLEMEDIVVTFGDGSTFSPKTKVRFQEGSRTRNIDLPGNKREIRHVEFTFRSLSEKKGESTVKLYGR
jgi:hypothetical protein